LGVALRFFTWARLATAGPSEYDHSRLQMP
jgi:hypothetical protein